MSEPSIVRGSYIDIAVFETDAAVTPTILCGVTTRSFTEQTNTSDTFVRDCADPEDIPNRRLVVTGEQWDMSAEALYNRAQGNLLRTIRGKRLKYRFIMGEPAADDVDAGHFEGYARLLTRTISGADGEFMTSTLAFASDGPWTWAPAA